jgi:hypothetical protein
VIVFFPFDSGDFVEAALVAASGKGCAEESLHHFDRGVIGADGDARFGRGIAHS